jgi:hypothetical protein
MGIVGSSRRPNSRRKYNSALKNDNKRVGNGNSMCWSDCKSKMQGSLHCAADDETVRCFGREDDFFWGEGGTDNDDSQFLPHSTVLRVRNDKQKSVEE